VVLDGSALSVTPRRTADGAETTTLLGHLAYGLGGVGAWREVADDDRAMHGSSTVDLARLLALHAPCLILFDETLEYLNKALSVRAHDGNLAAVTLTFIKELTTAVANTPGAAMLATLTSSRMEDYAEIAGQEMQERLAKVVGRAENIVTPVEGDDIFPILHRRLFSTIGTAAERREVADAYADYYQSLGDVLPATFTEQAYRDRIASAYPFHPELVDILTNRWGSLSGFQRTRGALRTLAHTVKALSQQRHRSPLIQPGDVPLSDAGVRAEVLRFAGDSYKAALNADIIRSDSKAAEEDARRGGVVKDNRLAVGLATTAFLDSFGPDKVLGASGAQLILGASRPGISRGIVEDVRDALEHQLWYMRLEGGRYRFTTEPNLNKVVLEREAAIADSRITQLLREAISAMTPEIRENGQTVLRTVSWVHDSRDLPDEARLTLGVLDFDHRIGSEATDATLEEARRILDYRGDTFRTNKNSAFLLAADGYAYGKARSSARTLAALRDVATDNQRLKRFNAEQRDQLTKRLQAAEERLPQQLVMAYRHLLLLGETSGKVALDKIDLGPARAGANLSDRVLEYLRGADRLIDKLAPAALLSERFGLLPDDVDAIEVKQLADWFAQLTRLPRLASLDVLRHALADGARQKVFGLVSGSGWKAEDAVLRFGTRVDSAEIQFQPGTWLVRAGTIQGLIEERGTPGAEKSEPVRPAGGEQPAAGTDEGETGPTLVPGKAKDLPSVTLRLKGVPAAKARDVIKVAVLPLSSAAISVELDITISADGGLVGIPRDTLELVVLEGLRQLGIEVEFGESGGESSPGTQGTRS
jgi:hypothetical protein